MARKTSMMRSEGIGEDTTWDEALGAYLNFMRGAGRAAATIALYRDMVSRFYRERRPVWDDEGDAFLDWNGEAQVHTNHRLDSCVRFWRWAVSAGLRKTNPAEGVPRRSVDRCSQPNVSLADIERVARVFRDERRARPHSWERTRDLAYFLFSLGTGVRPGEGLAIRRDDICLRDMCAIVRGTTSKTRQSRAIFIPDDGELVSLMRRMMRIQEASGFPGSVPLFSDCAGAPITSETWYQTLRKRAVIAGVKLKPYDLRHAFITHSLAAGANPYDIRDQVGHRNMEMMQRYYHSTPEARRRTAAFAPLMQLKSAKS